MTQDYRQRKEFQDYAREAQLRFRLRSLRVLLACLFISYLGCFWYFQVVRADHFRSLSDSNRIRTLPVPPLRGTIVDREGRVLAKNRPSFTLVATDAPAGGWERTRDRLAALLEVEPALLEERLRRSGRASPTRGIVLQEDVSLADAAFIESHPEQFPGVRVQVEPRRFYDGGVWASHLVGYVGEVSQDQMGTEEFPDAVPGDIVGKAGLERRFNHDLTGVPGSRQVVVNALGREIDRVSGETPAAAGSRLELTVDLDLQRALAEGFDGRVGSGVVIDPRNGEVLALGSFPSYDPNLFAGRFTREEWERLARDPRHPLQNRAAQSRFSAGSTFKIIVAAAALESGVIDTSRRIYCPGHARIYGRLFRCHFAGGHGWVNVHEALVKSCNVFFYQVGKDLGIGPIADYARRLGLGAPTGIDLVREDGGLVPDEAWSRRVRGTPWYPGETISVSIGQGPLLVTPLQMAAVAGALGTGGFPQLHLARRLGGRDVAPVSPVRPLRLAPSTLQVLRSALFGVVNEEGTGRRARLPERPDVHVAGKTGTVQVVAASAGVDSEELPEDVRDHSWFIGYAPAEEPTIAFAIFVEHGGHGGAEAAPIARRVLEVFFGKQARDGEVRLAQG
ncbi:MAG: penicillin-binding protein 2 [Acidobacteriota bacterium]